MNGPQRFVAAIMLAASSQLVHPGLAAAQTALQGAGDQGAGGSPAQAEPGQKEEAAQRPVPVFAITSIEIMRSTHEPVLDVVRVRGLASTGGWSAPELLPLTRGAPVGGVLDLVLVADPPAQPTGPATFAPVEAILPIEPQHPFNAVRVRAATNSLTVTGLPGYAEAKPPVESCNNCVGKLFLGQGASAPAGTAPGDIIRQENLPPNLRLLRPNDGVGSLDANPNRLTLVIGDDGRITDAAWD